MGNSWKCLRPAEAATSIILHYDSALSIISWSYWRVLGSWLFGLWIPVPDFQFQVSESAAFCVLRHLQENVGGRVGESIKASLGYRPSSSGPEFDSQVSIVAPTPGHAPLHIQFTRFRRSFTVPPYTEFHTTNSTTLLMVRKGDSPSNCV